MNNLLLLTALLFIVSCNSSPENANQLDNLKSEGIIINPEENRTLLLSSIIEDIKYIALETTEENIVETVEKIIPFKENLYLMDNERESLFIFHRNGNFMGEINQVGRGPGEYFKIDDFIIDEDEEVVEIYDKRQQKIFKFTLGGEYITFVAVGIVAALFSKIDTEKYAFYDFFSKVYPYNLTIANENGEVFQKYFYIDEFKGDIKVLTHHFSKSKGALSFLKWPGDTIYDITSASINPKYHINFTGDIESEVHYFTESSDFITFMFPIERKALTAFYCKSNKSLIITDNMINDINGIPFLKPIAIRETEFISVANAFSFKMAFLDKLEGVSEYVKESDLNRVKQFVDGIEDNDNPILIFSKFKNF